MWHVGLVWMLIIQLTWGLCPDTATQTTERAANAVTLRFYRGQVDSWTSAENSAKVAVQISDKAQTICSASAPSCGLENCCTSAFKETDVGTESGYPKNLNKDLELRIYVDLPTTINATASPFCVLSKSVLRNIVEQARDNIHSETGRWITWVDDEIFYGIPPATDLNKIIIPLAFLIVFVIAGVVIGLNIWKKKKDADARRMKIIQDRKKNSKSKVQPTYNIEKNPEKDLVGVDDKTGKPKRKDQLYKDNLRKKQSSARSSGTVVVSETEPYQRQGYAYERKQEVSAGAMGRDDGFDGRNGHGNSYPMKQMHRDGVEPGYAPVTQLTPMKAESTLAIPDTEASPEKKKKKKKKRSKSKENMKEYENPNYYDDSDYRS